MSEQPDQDIIGPRYQGDPIVEEDSFLASLPISLKPEISYWIGAIVYAADAIAISWQALINLTIDARRLGRTRYERASMFNAAWCMVDSIHTARLAIKKLSKIIEFDPPPSFTSFLKTSETASKLRNSMDHVLENSGNLANKNSYSSPLFGTLIYALRDAGEEDRPFTVFEHSGPMVGGGVRSEYLKPDPVADGSPATSQFTLDAFDYRIDFTEVVEAFCLMIWDLDAIAQANFRASLGQPGLTPEQRQSLGNPAEHDRHTLFVREHVPAQELIGVR